MPSASDLASIRVLVDTFHDSRAWTIDEGSIDPLPNSAHDSEESLRRFDVIEIKIDEHVLWIADGSVHAIAPHACALAPGWVAVKGRTPTREVADRMFDLDRYHHRTSHVRIAQLHQRDERSRRMPASAAGPFHKLRPASAASKAAIFEGPVSSNARLDRHHAIAVGTYYPESGTPRPGEEWAREEGFSVAPHLLNSCAQTLMPSASKAGILAVRRQSGYKDIPGIRYHFPKANYLKDVLSLVDALVLLC